MKSIFATSLTLMSFALTVVAANAATRPAPAETVIHQFNQVSHGYFLNAVVADAVGNLYGTTIYGGAYNHGSVFELSPQTQGQWKETVLYSFTGGSDGDAPEGGVTLDAAGNIYGTTYVGGASGSGAVFRLTQNGNGSWTEYVLHSFGGTDDGAEAFVPVVVDSSGNVFGITFKGGTDDYGIVFELTESSGSWTENILHTFSGGADGGYPTSLMLGKDGNLYGSAEAGGVTGNGLVFELAPSRSNSWKESVLYAFAGGNNGYAPVSLIFNFAGDLFGTTSRGGTGASCGIPNIGCGTVFELSPQAGTWKETTLYNFTNSEQDDGSSVYPLITTFDADGNLYGITNSGGDGCNGYGCGSAFELSPGHHGSWNLTNEYDFTDGSDGQYPASLSFGLDGAIYGSSSTGGPTQWNGCVFKLNAGAGGKWKLTTLYGFPFSDGAAPYTNLLPDGLGDFYGTSSYGGAYDLGSVFELTPNANGGWKETIIYSVPSGRLTGVNGVSPSSLIRDSAGNLYGITSYGGVWQYGSMFELSPSAGGGWTEQELYHFSNLAYPQGGLVFDKAGNLYGTTTEGGTYGDGIIFQLTPGAGGTWNFNTIYNFQGYPSDGADPMAALVLDEAGNLYGTTQKGGPSTNCVGGAGKPLGCGTVFELSLVAQQWTEKPLYSFMGSSVDGSSPESNLIFDGAGNLYGTTANGGNEGPCLVNKIPSCGIVFELSPTAGGDWSERILYEFTNANGDGSTPLAGLLFDKSGNLYGTTSAGGAFSASLCRGGCGTAFELAPSSGGGWTESVLHSFGSGYDGTYPASGLVLDSAGNLYGTTAAGGQAGVGTIFKIKP